MDSSSSTYLPVSPPPAPALHISLSRVESFQEDDSARLSALASATPLGRHGSASACASDLYDGAADYSYPDFPPAGGAAASAHDDDDEKCLVEREIALSESDTDSDVDDEQHDDDQEEEEGEEEDDDDEDEILSIIASSESASSLVAAAACPCPSCSLYKRIPVDCSGCLKDIPLSTFFSPAEAAYYLENAPTDEEVASLLCLDCRTLANAHANPQALTGKFGQCNYCHKLCTLTIEHIQPQSMGGDKKAPENLARVCQPCNIARGHSTYAQFLAQLRASTRPWRAAVVEAFFERRGISWADVDARSARGGGSVPKKKPWKKAGAVKVSKVSKVKAHKFLEVKASTAADAAAFSPLCAVLTREEFTSFADIGGRLGPATVAGMCRVLSIIPAKLKSLVSRAQSFGLVRVRQVSIDGNGNGLFAAALPLKAAAELELEVKKPTAAVAAAFASLCAVLIRDSFTSFADIGGRLGPATLTGLCRAFSILPAKLKPLIRHAESFGLVRVRQIGIDPNGNPELEAALPLEATLAAASVPDSALGGAGGAEAAAPTIMPLRFNAAIEWYSSRNPDIPADEIRTALTTVRQVLGGAIPAPPTAVGIAGACQAATYVPLAAIEARFQADADLAAVCRPLGLTGEDQRLRKLLADLAEQRGLIDVRPQQHSGGGVVADPLAVELRWVQDWEPPVLNEGACVQALGEFFLLVWTASRAENPALKGGFMFLIQLGAHLQHFGLRDGLDLAALARVFNVRSRLKTVLYAISAKYPQRLQVRQALVPGTQHEDTEARWTGVGNQGWD